MSHKKTTPEPPAEPTLKAFLPLWPTALSYPINYSIYRHHNLSEPSSLVEVHSQRNASAHLVDLRPTFPGFARACNHGLDGGPRD
jgi:hypothetical protein